MTNEIIKVVPTLQSVALAANALKLVKKKKKKASDFISSAGSTIIGSAMIKEESDFLEGF